MNEKISWFFFAVMFYLNNSFIYKEHLKEGLMFVWQFK